ncbi:hypothetical protein PCK1_003070 [Pneumocystis canis]|nr:hypothetical protein PCK1_003070 [Pneumocystis canis]
MPQRYFNNINIRIKHIIYNNDSNLLKFKKRIYKIQLNFTFFFTIIYLETHATAEDDPGASEALKRRQAHTHQYIYIIQGWTKADVHIEHPRCPFLRWGDLGGTGRTTDKNRGLGARVRAFEGWDPG